METEKVSLKMTKSTGTTNRTFLVRFRIVAPKTSHSLVLAHSPTTRPVSPNQEPFLVGLVPGSWLAWYDIQYTYINAAHVSSFTSLETLLFRYLVVQS